MVGIQFCGRENAVIAVLALVQHAVAAGLGRDKCALSRSTAAGTATGGSTNNAGRTAGVRTTPTTVASTLALPAILLRRHCRAGAARSREQNNRARQD
jgi:hypothetical protein